MTKVQRYKVGYYTDEWGMSSNTPCLVPDDSGYAVKFEDYCKLETELAAKDEVIAEAGEMLAMLDRQLAALKTELREICAAIDDPACDLTLTTVECIKKLRADNESLKLDAERWRKIEQQWSSAEIRNNLDGSFKSMTITFEAPQLSDELTMEKLRRDFDAAMAKGEQGC